MSYIPRKRWTKVVAWLVKSGNDWVLQVWPFGSILAKQLTPEQHNRLEQACLQGTGKKVFEELSR